MSTDRIRNLAENSTRILGPAVFPSGPDEFLLSNGLSAIQFLQSIGDDKIEAKDIGIDRSGRLFRILPCAEGCGEGKPGVASWADEYALQVDKYNKKHKTDIARAATRRAIDAFAKASREDPSLYEGSYVSELTEAIRYMSEVHFHDKSLMGIVDECASCIGQYEYEIAICQARLDQFDAPAEMKVLEWLEIVSAARNFAGVSEKAINDAVENVRRHGKFAEMKALFDNQLQRVEELLSHIEEVEATGNPLLRKLKL